MLTHIARQLVLVCNSYTRYIILLYILPAVLSTLTKLFLACSMLTSPHLASTMGPSFALYYLVVCLQDLVITPPAVRMTQPLPPPHGGTMTCASHVSCLKRLRKTCPTTRRLGIMASRPSTRTLRVLPGTGTYSNIDHFQSITLPLVPSTGDLKPTPPPQNEEG